MRQQKSKIFSEQKRMAKANTKAKTRKATRAKKSVSTRSGMIRINTNAQSTPQKLQRQASYVKDGPISFMPVFLPCALVGPDGRERLGWEMRVGEMMFGRADSKESLLSYYTRLHDPLPSGHWRDRAWQPQKKKATGRRSRKNRDGDVEAEELEREEDEAWEE